MANPGPTPGCQLRALNRLRARRPCHWHRCRWDRWSGVVRIRRRDRGGLRSSRADTRTPVPPWPHASTMIQWRQPSARAWLRL